MTEKRNSSAYSLISAYNKIEQSYNRLKKKPWKDFIFYLNQIESKINIAEQAVVIDVGGANGRNLMEFSKYSWTFIIVDLNFNLLLNHVDIENRAISCVNNNMTELGLKNKCADILLYIATIHHLSSVLEVKKAFSEIKRIMKNDGFAIVSVWRRWKKDTILKMLGDLLIWPLKKIQHPSWRLGDIYIEWKNTNKEVIARRYYHLFTRFEIKRIVKKTGLKIKDIRILGGKKGKDNIFLLLSKQ